MRNKQVYHRWQAMAIGRGRLDGLQIGDVTPPLSKTIRPKSDQAVQLWHRSRSPLPQEAVRRSSAHLVVFLKYMFYVLFSSPT